MRLSFTFLAFTLIIIQDIVLSLPEQGKTYWTKWLDRDNATGYGDEETYKDFPTKPCMEDTGFTPVEAECRIKNSRKPWYTAEKVIEKCYACTTKGILCSNQAQGCGKNVCCPDFEIRFLCYKERETYWTSWLDRDDPTSTGDHETYNNFSTKPCKEVDGYQPVEARCRIKQTQLPWYTVKKVIDECHACTAEGIACMNNQQYGCNKNEVCCPDYEIQFLCHKASDVYSSCLEALQKTRNAKNGFYYIRNSNGSTKTYCQMTSLTGCSGGGWTLVMKTDGTKETFSYSSSYWQNKQSFNPAGGLSGLDGQETKLPTYWSTSFKELCVGMKVGNDLKFVSINYPASSLYDLIADGKYRATSLGRQKWKSLISGSSMQKNCNQEGFNVVGNPSASHGRTRIGFIGNQENNCQTPDSYLGFGGAAAKYRIYCGVQNVINTCGNSATCSPDNGDKEIKAMGYIFVR